MQIFQIRLIERIIIYRWWIIVATILLVVVAVTFVPPSVICEKCDEQR